MAEDTRTAWQKRLGVGERQPRDSVVTDGTRTHTWAVPHVDDGHVAGTQTEHRSGRVDAKVYAPHLHTEHSKKELPRGRE